jgi:Na+(H+)/acetate symporter ActP
MKFSTPKFLKFNELTLKNNIAIGYVVSMFAVLSGLGSIVITVTQKNNLFLLAVGFTVLAVIMLRFFKRSLNVINAKRQKDDHLTQLNEDLKVTTTDLNRQLEEYRIKLATKDSALNHLDQDKKSLTEKVDDLTSQLAIAIANAKPVKKPAKKKTPATPAAVKA